MCLVISLLLAALAVNFYLNGFLLQSLLAGIVASVLLILVLKNIKCTHKGCKTDYSEKKKNDR